MKQIKEKIAIILSVFSVLFCAMGPSVSAGKDLKTANDMGGNSGADDFLGKIKLFVSSNRLNDDAYFSNLFGIRLAGGEPESGVGNMVYECSIGNQNLGKWTGRRYRYQSAPSYIATQPNASTSKCFNPYSIDVINPMHRKIFIQFDIDPNKLCLSETEIKRYFPNAYYSESPGRLSVRSRWGTLDDPIVMGIESYGVNGVCARSIFFRQNNFTSDEAGF